MSSTKLEYMFTGFCGVSGSPVTPGDYNRYAFTLPKAGGGTATGYMHFCCWPCVCDTNDFIKVDTKTITTADGPKQYKFGVLGNPCANSDKLSTPFTSPFTGQSTTLTKEAPEVRCSGDRLIGATMSDNGNVIISMFFDGDATKATKDTGAMAGQCSDRAAQGFNSGMGLIFRKVAEITPAAVVSAGSSASSSTAATAPTTTTAMATDNNGGGQAAAAQGSPIGTTTEQMKTSTTLKGLKGGSSSASTTLRPSVAAAVAAGALVVFSSLTGVASQ